MSYAIEIRLMPADRWEHLEYVDGGFLAVFYMHMEAIPQKIIMLSRILGIEKHEIEKTEFGKIALKVGGCTEYFITDVPYNDFVDSLCVKIGPKPKRRSGK